VNKHFFYRIIIMEYLDDNIIYYLEQVVQTEDEDEIVERFKMFDLPTSMIDDIKQRVSKQKITTINNISCIVINNTIHTSNIKPSSKANDVYDSLPPPILDTSIKKQIIQNFAYQEKKDTISKPFLKFEEMPKVRYRDDKIVSTKGERFV
jgi:crotonobetainyl-CoA:carnitine CoA-transferase CaiB-like acyl-CoA transferase